MIKIDEKKLSNFRYWDDVAQATEGVKGMEHQLKTVIEESLKTAEKAHKGRTKFMTNIGTTDNIQTMNMWD